MLEGDISTLVRDVDKLDEEAQMWKQEAAAAALAAQAATTALEASTAETAALRRKLAEFRAVLEQARSMDRCKYVKSICVVHLKISVFDLSKAVACRNM